MTTTNIQITDQDKQRYEEIMDLSNRLYDFKHWIPWQEQGQPSLFQLYPGVFEHVSMTHPKPRELSEATDAEIRYWVDLLRDVNFVVLKIDQGNNWLGETTYFLDSFKTREEVENFIETEGDWWDIEIYDVSNRVSQSAHKKLVTQIDSDF